MADYIYQESGGSKESVHLEEWPRVNKKLVDKNLEKKMAQVRKICSLALQARAEKAIKVRQPLAKIQIPNYKIQTELLDLIKDEVNVKEVVCDSKIKDGVVLDTTITDELKEEGLVRDFVRQIQALRKKEGLAPKDKINVYFSDENLRKIIEKNKEKIKKQVIAEDVVFEEGGLKIKKL